MFEAPRTTSVDGRHFVTDMRSLTGEEKKAKRTMYLRVSVYHGGEGA